MSTRVLVVDDEPAITDAVSYTLEAEGFAVDVRSDGDGALEAAQHNHYDLVILDIMLPKLSGFEVCRRLRADGDIPILVLSARDAEVDRVLGLEIGADDYVTKPFSMPELLGRVRAILRRRQLDRTGGVRTEYRVGALRIDLVRHLVTLENRPVSLTPSEFKLLTLLASEPSRVFSRRELMQHLWDSDYVGDVRACDIHLSNLRRKLERDPAEPERLVTVRGAGYKLEAV